MPTNSKHFCTTPLSNQTSVFFIHFCLQDRRFAYSVYTDKQIKGNTKRTVRKKKLWNAEVDTGPWQMFNKCVLKINGQLETIEHGEAAYGIKVLPNPIRDR